MLHNMANLLTITEWKLLFRNVKICISAPFIYHFFADSNIRVKLVGLFSSKWNNIYNVYIEGMGILYDIPKRRWQIFWYWRRHAWDSESCTIKNFLEKASNFFCTPATCLWSRGTTSTFQFTIRNYLYIFQHNLKWPKPDSSDGESCLLDSGIIFVSCSETFLTMQKWTAKLKLHQTSLPIWCGLRWLLPR